MKKWLIGSGIVGVLAVVLVVGSLATGAFAQGSTPPAPPQGVIMPEEAKAAALAANPGTTAIEVELENENGALVYEVELDNGQEVMVDASDGTVLGSEQEDADESVGDTDDVQDEVESETEDVDDAEDADEAGDVDEVDDELETSDAQDALGQ